MREQRVEMWLTAEVENLRVVRVVKVRKDAQELSVNVFDGRGERGREVLS